MILSTTLEIIFSKDLYVSTVGKSSPLFGGAAEGKAKALQKDGQFEKAFEAQKKKKSGELLRGAADLVGATILFLCVFFRGFGMLKNVFITTYVQSQGEHQGRSKCQSTFVKMIEHVEAVA